eukprot:CAMPEP_0201874814 /NCGR_PEP_ID=MMETSP0902-20130614/6960_1 /ASSEMBLY_ACC=CAM_ASM_000551 /TAXON_ID=420261 /ORGANISM="Thalassiosira antarctica, Strain CCMP982" /LENGTH=62 /DNA_ID=CAMNT_0048401745 /DNA_START=143 /DNA_END=328 /DNA_ORIENTATION=-
MTTVGASVSFNILSMDIEDSSSEAPSFHKWEAHHQSSPEDGMTQTAVSTDNQGGCFFLGLTS